MLFHRIISTILVLMVFVFLIIKLPLFKNTRLNKTWRLGLFAVKLLASLAILALYTWYYPKETADFYKYFEDGKNIYKTADSPQTWFYVLSGIKPNNPEVIKCTEASSHWHRKYLKGVWNDNRSIIRLNSLLYPITGGSLIAHSFVFAFLAYLGLTLLFIGIKRFVDANPKWLALAVFMIPNLLFWSSGLLKEALLILNLGILFYAVSKLYDKFTIKHFLLFLLGAGLFITIKIYVLICMIPAMVFLLFAKNRKNKLLYFGLSHIIIIAAIFSTRYISQEINLPYVMDRKQQDFINMVDEYKNVGSDIEVPNVNASGLDIVKKAPVGFINTTFRPHPLEWKDPLKALAGIENIGLLLLLIFALIKTKRPNSDQWNFLLFSFSFVVIFYAAIGLSTPVLGALVRYKIPALPFIGSSIVLLLNLKQKKIKYLINRH